MRDAALTEIPGQIPCSTILLQEWPFSISGINKIVLVIIALLIAAPAPAREILTYAEAINIAGRQRMLTQRMVKSYCQIGLDISREQSRSQLEQAVTLFEDQLRTLENFASDQETSNSLKTVRKIWAEILPMIHGPVEKTNAGPLARVSDELLTASDKVVGYLQQSSGTELARLVNLSGRQRMLSQRAAKLYLFRAWGTANDSIEENLGQVRKEFDLALADLKSSDVNTPLIRSKLDSAADQWIALTSALDIGDSGSIFPLVVSDSSDKMLQSFEEITYLYEALAALEE